LSKNEELQLKMGSYIQTMQALYALMHFVICHKGEISARNTLPFPACCSGTLNRLPAILMCIYGYTLAKQVGVVL